MSPKKLHVPFTQNAFIHRTEKFISVQPISGYAQIAREDDGYILYLDPDAMEEALGHALFEALSRSRFLDPVKDRPFFKADRIVSAAKRWESDIMKRFGYKTRAAMYRNMSWCHAARSEGKISIRPNRPRGTPGEWDFLFDRTVVIPATVDAVTAGEAVKLALSRCA